jgi:hypothetical protein
MRIAVLVCAVLVALLAVQPVAARLIDKNYHETFDVKEGMKLILLHGDGDVTITPWDQDVIDVKIRYHADITSLGFGVEVDFKAEFKEMDNTVFVKGTEGGTAGIFFMRSTNEYEHSYTISAPSYVILELRGDDGDVEISGWRAAMDCALDDGDVSISDVVCDRLEIDFEDGDVELVGVTGEVALRGDDGDVAVSNSTFKHALFSVEDGSIDVMDTAGHFEVSVDDGDVDFRRVTSALIDIRGNDGDVDLDLIVGPEFHTNVATDDGDVTMRLSGELSFDYLVTMDDGDVDVYMDDATDTEADDHRVSGVVGDGEGHVRIRTSDGDVTIMSGG